MSSADYPPETSEVELLGLATVPGELVQVPRLAAAPLAMECRFHSVTPYGEAGAEFFVGEVLAFHARESVIDDLKIDSMTLNPICRVAGPNYATLGEKIPAKRLG